MDTVVQQVAAKWAVDPGRSRRLFHGRGHTFAGYEHVVVNWFAPVLQVVLFRPTPADEVDALVQSLLALAGAHQPVTPVQGVVVQQRQGRGTESHVHWGEVPDELVVTEAECRYYVQPRRNQNVGLFMDMGHVRTWLSSRVAGKRVLNLFAYTCAFSVSAIAHGATLVVNNDMSKPSLETGARNHELNGHDLRSVRMLPHNLFKSWWKLRQLGPFDVVIIDPPTNQRGSFVAEKSYGQVLKRLPEFTAPDALVLVCLNSPFLGVDFLTGQVSKWAPQCELEYQFPLHEDFPDQFPDRALKVLAYRYRG